MPLPGCGHTEQRWSVLASVADEDLALVKLFEGHTDALAILAEIGGPHVAGKEGKAVQPAKAPAIWSVWAAEPPDA